MSGDERKKSEILLNQWIKHNREHAEEFSKWAEKAKDFGQTIVNDEILEAVQQMNQANECLLRALEKLQD